MRGAVFATSRTGNGQRPAVLYRPTAGLNHESEGGCRRKYPGGCICVVFVQRRSSVLLFTTHGAYLWHILHKAWGRAALQVHHAFAKT